MKEMPDLKNCWLRQFWMNIDPWNCQCCPSIVVEFYMSDLVGMSPGSFRVVLFCKVYYRSYNLNEKYGQGHLPIFDPGIIYQASHTKLTEWLCAQWRQISLGIHPVWSESSLWDQWVAIKKGPKLSSCGHRRLIRPGGCPGWSECLLGDNAILLVLSWDGSFVFIPSVRVGAPVQPLSVIYLL